jgi:hypothetical protein
MRSFGKADGVAFDGMERHVLADGRPDAGPAVLLTVDEVPPVRRDMFLQVSWGID